MIEHGGSEEEARQALGLIQTMDLDAGPVPEKPLPLVTTGAVGGEEIAGYDDGLDTLDGGDIEVGLLKVRQPTTQDADQCEEGFLFIADDPGGGADRRTVTLLRVDKTRRLMLPKNSDAAEGLIDRVEQFTGVEVPDNVEAVICRSDDRVSPVSYEGGTPALSADCAGCPMGKWRRVRGKNVQDCNEGFRLLLWDWETDRPVTMHAYKSAMRGVKAMLTVLRVATRKHNLPACNFSMDVSTRKHSREDGVYYTPQFSKPELADETVAELLRGTAQSLAKARVKYVEEVD